jgi:hypothetical protein
MLAVRLQAASQSSSSISIGGSAIGAQDEVVPAWCKTRMAGGTYPRGWLGPASAFAWEDDWRGGGGAQRVTLVTAWVVPSGEDDAWCVSRDDPARDEPSLFKGRRKEDDFTAEAWGRIVRRVRRWGKVLHSLSGVLPSAAQRELELEG